jgi:hypothetical protein
MTSIGFHYYPDDVHYRTSDLQSWLPELQALGARWLTVVGSLTRAVPEPFIRGLRENGIEPIVLMPATPIRSIEVARIMPLFQTYARWGVRYVSVFAEPNSRASWSLADWSKTGLVGRFLEIMIPVWQAQAGAGLVPVFPALKAGGEYWDTAFLEASLQGLQQRGRDELAHQLAFALNTWTFNRPVTWGAGGPAAWPDAKPYATPAGSQDQRGFHIFDWYNAIFERMLGERKPLLSLAGGPRLGDQTDVSQPSINDARHATCIKDIKQLLASQQLPENLLNLNFWLLTATAESPFAREAWFQPDGRTLTAVSVLRQGPVLGPLAPTQPMASKHVEPVEDSVDLDSLQARLRNAPKSAQVKPFRHYLLMPTFEFGVSEWHWQAALDFVRTHRPVVGFSVDEALRSERVTIFGNTQGIDEQVEARLAEAGCQVERVMVGQVAV